MTPYLEALPMAKPSNQAPAASCEFCREFCWPRRSTYFRNLGALLESRLLPLDARFLAVPSLGQLLPNSVMIVPWAHVERFADLDPPLLRRAEELARYLSSLAGATTVVFEHGARASTGGSCGIFHAHLHLIPLPSSLSPADLAHGLEPTEGSLSGTLAGARRFDEYLYFSDTQRTWFRVLNQSDRSDFPSQYFRKAIRTATDSELPWDWRQATQPEIAVLDSYRFWASRLSRTEQSREVISC